MSQKFILSTRNIQWKYGLASPDTNTHLINQIFFSTQQLMEKTSENTTELTHWPLGNPDAVLKIQFSILFSDGYLQYFLC